MSHSLQTQKAALFRALHEDFFVMPTVWDPLSALAAQEAGFKAVASSSAALGQALGIRTNERIPFDQAQAQLARIAASISIPVSIDMEDGYPEVEGGVPEAIRQIIQAGVVAANIEDSWDGHARPLAAISDHARRIEKARKAADASLSGFFINARTDLFLQEPGVEPEVSVLAAITRARAYVEAGADGIYVTAKDLDDQSIAALVAAIPAPLTLVLPETRSFENWPALGVKRGSLGTVVIRTAWSAIQKELLSIQTHGRISALPPSDIDGAILRNRAA